MSGEVNLKTSRKDRGKELLTSEGWGSNRYPNFTPLSHPTVIVDTHLTPIVLSCSCLMVPRSH